MLTARMSMGVGGLMLVNLVLFAAQLAIGASTLPLLN